MKCRSTEVQTWGTHRTDRAQTKKVGGHWVPQLRSLPAILARGLRIRPAHSPVPPTLYCPVGKSVARGLSRVLFGAAVGAKTPNSGGTEQHRSTIALAGSLRPKKASVEAHQAAGDQSTSYNLLITSLKCVSVTDRPKTFVRPLTSLLLCCARTTAHVAVFRVRQQRNLHLGSHIKLLALFLKLSLILCTKESSQIEAAHT